MSAGVLAFIRDAATVLRASSKFTAHRELADRLDEARATVADSVSAMQDALSDFEWIERTIPDSNFQSSILRLKRAIQLINGPSALAVNVVERAPENNHEGIRPGSANGGTEHVD